MTDQIGQQFGNYQLIRLLGSGGFANVYLGEHIYLKTQAAIKVLQIKVKPNEFQGFLTEAQTIAVLRHPRIVRVLDFGVQGSLPFLVMDYARFGTLRDRHPSGSVLPITTVLLYVKQVAEALQYAHTNHLVHRDIKPENMLVEGANDLLLSDFGIAIEAHKTQSLSTQEAIGTVTYMAPEQIKGKARPASDQYSLGIVAYEWLCGTCPFEGATSIEIAMKHLMDSPPSLRSKVPAIPQEVEQVVFKALAKDPQQRYSSVQKFAEALEGASRLIPTTVRIASLPSQSSVSVPPPTAYANTSSLLPAQDVGGLPASQTGMVQRQNKQGGRIAGIFEMMLRMFNPSAAVGMTQTLQWNITGEEAGVWAFKIVNGQVELVYGGVKKPDVTFTLRDLDWLSICEGKLDAMNAFTTGKLKVAGDKMLAVRLAQLFPGK